MTKAFGKLKQLLGKTSSKKCDSVTVAARIEGLTETASNTPDSSSDGKEVREDPMVVIVRSSSANNEVAVGPTRRAQEVKTSASKADSETTAVVSSKSSRATHSAAGTIVPETVMSSTDLSKQAALDGILEDLNIRINQVAHVPISDIQTMDDGVSEYSGGSARSLESEENDLSTDDEDMTAGTTDFTTDDDDDDDTLETEMSVDKRVNAVVAAAEEMMRIRNSDKLSNTKEDQHALNGNGNVVLKNESDTAAHPVSNIINDIETRAVKEPVTSAVAEDRKPLLHAWKKQLPMSKKSQPASLPQQQLQQSATRQLPQPTSKQEPTKLSTSNTVLKDAQSDLKQNSSLSSTAKEPITSKPSSFSQTKMPPSSISNDNHKHTASIAIHNDHSIKDKITLTNKRNNSNDQNDHQDDRDSDTEYSDQESFEINRNRSGDVTIQSKSTTFCSISDSNSGSFSGAHSYDMQEKYHEGRKSRSDCTKGDKFRRNPHVDAVAKSTKKSLHKDVMIHAPGEARSLMVRVMYHVPAPRDSTDVVIKIEASTVSFRDCLIRSGLGMHKAPFPLIPGCQAVGKITAMGKIAKSEGGFKLGDRVMALSRHGGGNAKYGRFNMSCVIVIPERIDAADAACLGEVYMTAFQALRIGRKNSTPLTGSNILITDGFSPIGQATIMLAKFEGANVFVTATEASQESYLETLGVKCLPFSPSKWLPKVKGRMDIVIDNTCFDSYESSWKALNPKGMLVCTGLTSIYSLNDYEMGGECGCGGFGDTRDMEARWATMKAKYIMSQTKFYDLWESYDIDPNTFQQELKYLCFLLEKERIKPKIAEKVTIEEVPDAQRYLQTGKANGSIICLP